MGGVPRFGRITLPPDQRRQRPHLSPPARPATRNDLIKVGFFGLIPSSGSSGRAYHISAGGRWPSSAGPLLSGTAADLT